MKLLLDNFAHFLDAPNGIQKLRDMILQLAVSGKLVPQDPNDEPASVLLKKIKAEKEKLIKAKKIKKQKLLPQIIKAEIPFDIPESWEFERLGKFCQRIGSGSTPRGGKNSYVNKGIPFLRSQNVWNYGLKLNDVVFITDEINTKMSNTIVYPNDILLNITGASLGRCALIKPNACEMNVSQHVSIIRPILLLTKDYLHKCLLSPYSQNMIWKRQVGMAREGLSKKVLELFEIPIAPENEQKRIVAKVDELMQLCDQLEEQQKKKIQLNAKLNSVTLNQLENSSTDAAFTANWQQLKKNFAMLYTVGGSIQQGARKNNIIPLAKQNLDKLRQTILQLAVQGKLTANWRNENPDIEPASVLLEKIKAEKEKLIKAKKIKKQKPLPPITKDEKTLSLPNTWEWIRLGDFSEIKGGKRLPKGHYFSSKKTKYIYIQVTNMKQGTIIKDGLKYISEETQNEISRYVISKKDIYITIAGTIGDIGSIPDEFDGMNLTENAAKIIFIEVKKAWLQKTLSSRMLRQQFTDKTNQLAQPKLALHRIASSCIALPPLLEQKQIVAKVDQLMRLCDKLGKYLIYQHEKSTQLVNLFGVNMVERSNT